MNQKVVAFFKSLRFAALNADPSILIYYESGGDITMVSMYVGDFLLTSKTHKSIDWIKKRLINEYNVKDIGEVKTIIE